MPSLGNIETSPLALGDYEVKYAVTLRAGKDNAGVLYVGYNDDVTADSNAVTDGMFLEAGDAYIVPVYKLPNRNTSDIHVIADSGTNKLFYDVA